MSSAEVWFGTGTADSSEARDGGSSGNVMGIYCVGDGASVDAYGNRTYSWHINYWSGSNTTTTLSWGGSCYNGGGTLYQSTWVAAGGSASYSYNIHYTGGSGKYYEAKVTVYINNPANHTYTFDANGGIAGTVTSKVKVVGVNMVFPTEAESPTRASYINLGWSSSPTATEAEYAFGTSYPELPDSNKTYYAVWKLDYAKPSITSMDTDRRDPSTLAHADDGECIKVWGAFQLDPYQPEAVSPSEMKIAYMRPNGDDAHIVTLTGSALSSAIVYDATTRAGTFEYYIGASSHAGESACSGDFAWIIAISITDTRDASVYGDTTGTASATEFAAFAIVDIGQKGKNVTFGAAADDSIDLSGYPNGVLTMYSVPVMQLLPSPSDDDIRAKLDATYFIDGASMTFLDLKKVLRKLLGI